VHCVRSENIWTVAIKRYYKKTQVYDAGEYYAPEDDYSHFEEDNNE